LSSQIKLPKVEKWHLIAVFGVLFVLFAYGGWAGGVVARYVPNRSNFVPLFFFDSSEQYYPTTINFDGTWNTADSHEHYDRDSAPLALYYKEVRKENYVIYEFFPWYAYNHFINLHEVDPEKGVKIWVRDNVPFLFAISPHGEWKVKRVYSVNDLYAYVQRGSHGLYFSSLEAIPCDAQVRILPDNWLLIPVEDAMAHENDFLDVNGYFLIDEPGDLSKPWWTNDKYFYDPDNLIIEEFPEYSSLLTGEAKIPLSVVGAMPSLTTFLINASILILGAFVCGFLWKQKAWALLSLLAFLVISGIMIFSLVRYPPAEKSLSTAVITLNILPYGFAVIGALSGGFFSRFVVEEMV